MKNVLLFLLFTSIVFSSYSQSQYQDAIYLKDGSVYRGVIIEEVPNKSFKIKSWDNKEYVFQINEIEKLAKEIVKEDSNVNNKYNAIFDFGFEMAVGEYGKQRLKFNFINSFEANKNLFLGVGTGLRYYFYTEMGLIPLFVDIRTELSSGKLVPFLALDFGYSFNATDNFDDVGMLLSPSLGIDFDLSNSSSIHFSVGYEMQKMKITQYNYNHPRERTSTTENSSAISVNVGFTF